MEILGVCASYSISVKELKLIFSFLKGDESKWVSYRSSFYLVCDPASSSKIPAAAVFLNEEWDIFD